MKYYYIDTNPLLRFAEAQIPNASKICKQIAGETIRLIEDGDSNIAISEITIVELHSNLFTLVRDTTKPNFNQKEADGCFEQLMRWIIKGQIQVIPQPPKLFEKAIAYVRFAARSKACALRAWDAVHIVLAVDWARSLKAPVHIVTNDKAFGDFVNIFPEFKECINIYNPLKKKDYP